MGFCPCFRRANKALQIIDKSISRSDPKNTCHHGRGDDGRDIFWCKAASKIEAHACLRFKYTDVTMSLSMIVIDQSSHMILTMISGSYRTLKSILYESLQ